MSNSKRPATESMARRRRGLDHKAWQDYLSPGCPRRRARSGPTARDPSQIPGGYQITYTGLLRWTPAQQKACVERLARYAPGRVPESKRKTPDIRKRQGLATSYQWQSGGNRTHGFIYWYTYTMYQLYHKNLPCRSVLYIIQIIFMIHISIYPCWSPTTWMHIMDVFPNGRQIYFKYT